MKCTTTARLLALLLGFSLGSSIQADEFDAIRKAMATLVPGETADNIRPAPVPGLYEVSFGAQIFYVTKDGKYFVHGDVYDTAQHANLTEERRSDARLSALAKVGENSMIIFAPPRPKYTITVFTDIDCGYCRKLHSEIDQYLKEGIRVRYLFYPRAGVGSPSYDKAVAVWCATDRSKALTRAKAGQDAPAKSCANPVREHMELGERFGVNGTPAIVTESGRLLPGYVPAKRLSQALAAETFTAGAAKPMN
jgi:thiol:disulfide interchange protein DsbC